MSTYSSMTITFTNDWAVDDTLKIQYDNNGTISSEEWIWVLSRSAAYEVSSPLVPTTVNNFETAFDLDNPTGYVTTVQNVNELLIESETLGEDFIGLTLGSANFGTATVVFNNYVIPPTPATLDYALTRSPHYVNIPFNFDTTLSATINTFVWDGDLGTPPGTATYSLTKIRPTTDYAEFNVDLSKIVREQFDVKPVLNLTSSSQIVDSTADSVKFLKYTASYDDPSVTIPDIQGEFAALDGFGYMQEGVNPSVPSDYVLTSSLTRKVDRTGFILFPFVNQTTITRIDIDSNGGEINDRQTITSTNQSTDLVQYVCVDVSSATTDDYITITTTPASSSWVYQIVDECRYQPIQVVFKNKYGVFDTVTMFKKRTDKLSVTNEEFKNNYISNGSYDITNHQMQKINIVGKESVTLNSGYINEAENELYKEMLLSDIVFFYENASFVPVNVASKQISFKTRVNDKLTLYTIDFDYAFNTINNI